VLNFDQRHSNFDLHSVPDGCIRSLLRDSSASVKLDKEDDVTTKELAFLMANDTDEFNRWESGQNLMLNLIIDCIHASSDLNLLDDTIVQAFRETLQNDKISPALRAHVFTPPVES